MQGKCNRYNGSLMGAQSFLELRRGVREDLRWQGKGVAFWSTAPATKIMNELLLPNNQPS